MSDTIRIDFMGKEGEEARIQIRDEKGRLVSWVAFPITQAALDEAGFAGAADLHTGNPQFWKALGYGLVDMAEGMRVQEELKKEADSGTPPVSS
ncbi:MAG: hypothetical protein V3W28_06065 [Thermoplasmata archaeon]